MNVSPDVPHGLVAYSLSSSTHLKFSSHSVHQETAGEELLHRDAVPRPGAAAVRRHAGRLQQLPV